MIKDLNHRANCFYQRFVKLRASPHAIAAGMALGLFVGMSPFFGLHVLTAIGLAALFKWSKIGALIGVQITNALTAPFIYPVNYWIGAKLAGSSGVKVWPASFTLSELWHYLQQSKQIIMDLTIGGVVLGLPLAVCGYVVTRRIIIVYRRRHPPAPSTTNLSDNRGANADRRHPAVAGHRPERPPARPSAR